MSLFDSASLVVTPNGYKATKLYSVIPTDGTGDMTFARAGNTATRVNASGLIEAVNADIPRLDYTGGGCPKLLLEPQRTNLILQSQALASAEWGTFAILGTITRTNNYAISPDGTTNATRIQNSGGSTVQWTYQNIPHSTNVVTFWYKRTGSTDQTFRFFSNNGTVFTSLTATSVWQKFTGNITGSTTIPLGITTDASGNACDILIWGFQCEVGSYATSYIPTTTAAVTRNADVCTKTSATALIGQTEGTILLDLNGLNLLNFCRFFSLSSNNWLDNSIRFDYGTSSHKITIEGVYLGAAVFNFTTPNSYSSNPRLKIALAYKNNDVILYVNGIQTNILTTTGTIPSCSVVAFNELYLFGGREKVNYNSAALWKTRLSNADLAALTSL